jgi:hypothetical protein
MGRKESSVELGVEDNPEKNASHRRLGNDPATSFLLPATRQPNANVYCKQSDPGTLGHQYGRWAEMKGRRRHPIELH